MRRRPLALGVLAASVAAVLAPTADGSQLIDRNTSGVRLAVSSSGKALLTYRVGTRVRRVLAWGAVDARQPTRGVPQVRLSLDYSGPNGRFRDACSPYNGPSLAWLVAACTAPDGSHWAVQRWRPPLPNYGLLPWLPSQRATELHLSHWRGAPAQLEVFADWAHRRRLHHLFGRLTYRSAPVFGFGTTRYGAPTDGYGRLLYLDTFGSRYGSGWRRENSFVPHNPTGVFCYTFFRRGSRGPGNGERYRITANGPGVTPDVSWVGPGLPRFNRRNPKLVAHERAMNALLDRIAAGDRLCRSH